MWYNPVIDLGKMLRCIASALPHLASSKLAAAPVGPSVRRPNQPLPGLCFVDAQGFISLQEAEADLRPVLKLTDARSTVETTTY